MIVKCEISAEFEIFLLELRLRYPSLRSVTRRNSIINITKTIKAVGFESVFEFVRTSYRKGCLSTNKFKNTLKSQADILQLHSFYIMTAEQL